MKVKAILTIIICLSVGFVFGYMTSVQISKRQWENRHKLSYHEMFVFKTLRIIVPAETQKDTLLPVIEAYADKSLKLKNNVSREFDSLINRMNEDLKPLISEAQYSRLLDEAAKNTRRQH
jgi:hypothetical protein